MLDFVFDNKWKVAVVLFLIQAWLACEFFKRASFGVMWDGALLLGAVLFVGCETRSVTHH